MNTTHSIMTLRILLLLALSSLVSPEMLAIEDDLKVEGRITNGQIAKSGQFPWQAALNLPGKTFTFMCGGSLLSPTYVLTTARCMDGVKKVRVMFGGINRTHAEITTNSRRIIVHPGFRPSNLENDIALVQFSRVTFSKNIGTIKLPKEEDAGQNLTGELAITSGWGRTSDSATGVTDLLHWAQMEIISNQNCGLTYGDIITDTKLCTNTTGGTSPSQGDEGGALVRLLDGTQIGIISFGSSAGCQKGKPAVYTRVSKYVRWINSKIKSIV